MQAIRTLLQKITTPARYQSDFYGPDALPDIQSTASKHRRPFIEGAALAKELDLN